MTLSKFIAHSSNFNSCSNSTETQLRNRRVSVHIASAAAFSDLLLLHGEVLPGAAIVGACTAHAQLQFTMLMLCGIDCRQYQCSNSIVTQQRN